MSRKLFVLAILSIALLLSSASVVKPPSGMVTGGGWIDTQSGFYQSGIAYFDGSYYEVGYAPAGIDWDQAVALASASSFEACTSAHLATVTSLEEQAAVTYLMADKTENGWLGGSQPEDELSLADGWQWITGESWGFTFWAEEEPNDSPAGIYIPGSEQYLETYQGSARWNDAPVEPKVYYVIEYEGCDLASGRANFSVLAKDRRGTLTGRTRFQFRAAGLNFVSTGYDWLWVSGNSAVYAGEGTVNGQGGYKFTVWVEDGAPDTLRIEIFWEDGAGKYVVFDNGDQPIGGGNIVVHSGK